MTDWLMVTDLFKKLNYEIFEIPYLYSWPYNFIRFSYYKFLLKFDVAAKI